jgi:hypothetical protein
MTSTNPWAEYEPARWPVVVHLESSHLAPRDDFSAFFISRSEKTVFSRKRVTVYSSYNLVIGTPGGYKTC